ncbi:MAG TPA: ParA family protein, partial [Isosphaeraceae bacterium]|nr:ParA family protein [Isosphaeraceae bacterium]
MRRGLKPLEDRYDFMVLDCPPTLGVLTEAGIAAADFVVIPCQMEARAADGLVDLLEVVSIIKGEDFADWGILLTKFDKRKSATNQAILTALA